MLKILIYFTYFTSVYIYINIYNVFLYMYTYVKYIKIFNIFEKLLHRRLMISYLLVTGTLLKLYWTRMRP